MNEVKISIYKIGTTPDGLKDVYTDGNKLYTMDGVAVFVYDGFVKCKSDASNWKCITGSVCQGG